eukprot:CAMPEP_0198680474 /NCGR_PEP_ID=MMETSP1468-20131203/4913_1 /TAXON_ID=1461545 /ORGANISM="Mantoniella sp, Strain CCMP1436" /LENGTH=33 /DNA_ID= /DNA_START= /DNA_END= /DNA_ORIENTATION=
MTHNPESITHDLEPAPYVIPHVIPYVISPAPCP